MVRWCPDIERGPRPLFVLILAWHLYIFKLYLNQSRFLIISDLQEQTEMIIVSKLRYLKSQDSS